MKNYFTLLFSAFVILLSPHSSFGQTTTDENICSSENGGKAIAISEGSYDGTTMYANNVIDGDFNTFWASQWNMPAWLTVKFDRVYNVHKIGVWWGSHQQKFKISLSLDGDSWTTVVPISVSKNREGSAPVFETFNISNTVARFIRIDILETSAPRSHIFQAIVNELEAFSQNNQAVTNENVCLSSNDGRAIAISEGSYGGTTMYANKAIDGNSNTFWASQWNIPAWLTVKFDRVYNIHEVGVWWGSHKQKFKISLSLDGNSWTTVVPTSISNNYEGSEPVHQTFNISNTMARFIRIDILETSAPRSHIFQAIVNELEAY